jgi:hypothetical protein
MRKKVKKHGGKEHNLFEAKIIQIEREREYITTDESIPEERPYL